MKTHNIDIIVQNIIDMLEVNYHHKTMSIGENFIDWCENGDIFYKNDKILKRDSEECEEIMKEVAPFVNKLTDKLYNLYERGE